MTEAEWLACEDVWVMLTALPTGSSGRKFRLFAAACCRRIWHVFDDDRCRRAVDVAERFADGLATDGERQAAVAEFREPLPRGWVVAASAVENAPLHAAHKVSAGASTEAPPSEFQWLSSDGITLSSEFRRLVGCEEIEQAAVLRDIFRLPALTSQSLHRSGDPAIALAHAAYENRELPSGLLDPARLAVLSDALEEAGCTDAALLTHLRSPGPHVRGCWALDLVLGKA